MHIRAFELFGTMCAGWSLDQTPLASGSDTSTSSSQEKCQEATINGPAVVKQE